VQEGPGLALLAATGRLLRKPPVPGEIAAAIVALAVPTLADCAVVVLPPQRGRVAWWRHHIESAEAGTRTAEGRIGQGALTTMPGLSELFTDPDGGKSVLMTTCTAGGWPLPAGFTPNSDVLVVPLVDPASDPVRPLAALVLLQCASDDTEPIDLDLVSEFGARVGAALGNAIRFAEQTFLTAGLESSLLPAPLPTLPGVRLAAGYRPASTGLSVGGDFYEVYPQQDEPDSPVVFALGDACGHGPEAASLAGHVRSCLGALRLVETGPAKLLGLLNHAIRTTSASRFTTAVVGTMVPAGNGSVRLVLGCAGHPAPLIRRADGRVEEVAATGGLIGIFPDVRFTEAKVVLEPGDICLLYSDGLTEARRAGDPAEQFGTERLGELLGELGGATAADLVDAVEADVDRWLAGYSHDDLTLLAIQAVPEPVGE
jgi:serine phosphatase RsbU (regulator of sigma subunit)